MAICGYNNIMGNGIMQLFEGMYEAIASKAEREGSSFVEILKREIIEIPSINNELALGQSFMLQMFRGLNNLALPYFIEALKIRENDDHKAIFMAGVRHFLNLLELVEDYSLQALPPAENVKEAIAARASLIGQRAVELCAPESA